MNYSSARGQFEATIDEVFPGGMAEKMGLQAGYKICFKTQDNSPASLQQAITSFRGLATKECAAEDIAKITIINTNGRYVDIRAHINNPASTDSPLIHDKKTYSDSHAFATAITKTNHKALTTGATAIAAQPAPTTPSTPPIAAESAPKSGPVAAKAAVASPSTSPNTTKSAKPLGSASHQINRLACRYRDN